MDRKLPVKEFQDLGELTQTIRTVDQVGPSGVETIVPDDDTSFAESVQDFREVVDEHYGEHLDDLAGEGDKVIINRVVLQSDKLPYIEYQVVEESDDE